MNWISRIHSLLGSFWSRLFADREFILSVENVHALAWKMLHGALENMVGGMVIRYKGRRDTRMPIEILCPLESIHNPCSTVEEILSGSPIGDTKEGRGWVLKPLNIDDVKYITTSVSNASATLIRGLDFDIHGNELLLYVDPATVGFDVIKRTASDGSLQVCYRAIGLYCAAPGINNQVAGFMSEHLSECADAAWDVQLNGASVYNTKKLLGGAAGITVCECDGIVHNIWEEQGYTHVLIGDNVYSGKAPTGLQEGMSVKKGDIVFGSMEVFDWSRLPDEQTLPAIKVRTDAGMLTAQNKELPAYTLDGGNTALPLTGSESAVAAYKERVQELYSHADCPSIAIPDTVNPLAYITSVVRKGRSCIIVIGAACTQALQAAIDVIRKNTSVSGMVNVIIKTTSEGCELHADVSGAEAGNAAVHVECIELIEGVEATAEVYV